MSFNLNFSATSDKSKSRQSRVTGPQDGPVLRLRLRVTATAATDRCRLEVWASPGPVRVTARSVNSGRLSGGPGSHGYCGPTRTVTRPLRLRVRLHDPVRLGSLSLPGPSQCLVSGSLRVSGSGPTAARGPIVPIPIRVPWVTA